MARESPRISFNSSPFIRLLSDLAVVDVEVSRQPFAERLGLWLDWTAAIPLSAVLQTNPAARLPGAADRVDVAGLGGEAASEALSRVRAELAQSISGDSLLTSVAAAASSQSPAPASGGPHDDGADFLPYRRCYQAHQRQMQARIAPLRAQARAALAAQSPALAQLAALDGVLDDALGPRERKLLATVPALLERHFEQLQRAQPASQAMAAGVGHPPAPPAPAGWPQAWLAFFCSTVQGVLLAEMAIRLQPVEGLLEALCNKVARQT